MRIQKDISMPMSNHMKRALKYGTENYDVSITTKKVYDKYQGICQGCGVHTIRGLQHQVPHSATVEHKIPLSEGGAHKWNNVTLFCHECNVKANIKRLALTAPTIPDLKRYSFFGYVVHFRIFKAKA